MHLRKNENDPTLFLLMRDDGLVGADIYKEVDTYRRATPKVTWYVSPVTNWYADQYAGAPSQWGPGREFKSKREAVAWAEQQVTQYMADASV